MNRRQFLTVGTLGALAARAAGAAPRGAPATPKFIHPGHADYESARRAYNRRLSAKPAVIAECRDTAEVAGAVRQAKRLGLPVAIRSGGHSFEGFCANDGGMLLDVGGMNAVRPLGDHRFALGPGLRLGALYEILGAQNRLLPAGSCAGVGLAGLALGGGYGFFSRAHGLTCDHLDGLTLVDATGEIRDTKDDPELLRACRGGGNGNFGVVTELRFRTRPLPAGFRSHRFRHRPRDGAEAAAVLHRWFEATAALPTPCFSAFVLNGHALTILVTDFADAPSLPAATVAALAAGAQSHSSGDTKPTLESLRAFRGRADAHVFKNASAGCLRGYADLAPVAEAVLQTIMTTRGMIYQVNTLGGQIADPKAAAESCFAHRDRPYLAELQAYPQTGDGLPALLRAFGDIQKKFRDAGVRAHYANYPDLAFSDWEESYYGPHRALLRRVKARLDPANLFRHPQSVPAA